MIRDGAELTEEYVKEICRIDDGRFACSFLMAGLEGFECAKDTAIGVIIAEHRLKGEMPAMGDNCSGPPHFIPIEESVN